MSTSMPFERITGADGPRIAAYRCVPEPEASADYRVRIPIHPDIDSLNLAVAAGIALYRLM